MNKVFNVLIFAAGAAVGSLVTWRLLKTKYEQIAQEEIDSVKEVFANRDLKWEHKGEPIGKVENMEVTDEGVKATVRVKPDLAEYARKLNAAGYSNYEVTEEKGGTDVDEPYVISPEEFSENDDYDTESLTYYADGILTDDVDNIIEDVAALVGEDSLTRFGEYEDDSVFVRNDRTKTDYEILLDLRTYSDAVGKSLNRDDE